MGSRGAAYKVYGMYRDACNGTFSGAIFIRGLITLDGLYRLARKRNCIFKAMHPAM